MCLNQYKHFQDSKNSLINNTGPESIVYSVWNPGHLSFRCWLLAEEGWRRGRVSVQPLYPVPSYLPCFAPGIEEVDVPQVICVLGSSNTTDFFGRGCDSLPHIYTILGILGDLGDVICRLHASMTPFYRRNISIQILVPKVLLESVLHRYQGIPKRRFQQPNSH